MILHLGDLKLISLLFLTFFINSYFSQESRVTRSVVSMIDLVSAEHLLISALSKYTKNMEGKLNTMRKILNNLQYEHEKAEMDPEEYLGNPLRSFSLIRRLHSDWMNYEYYLHEDIPDILNIISEYASVLPDNNDLWEAVNSIQRLESTYNLKVEDMSVGLLNGIWYKSNFTIQDAYTIGYELYRNRKFKEAIPWLNFTLTIPFDHKMHKDIFHIEEKYIFIIYIKALIMENLYDDAKVAIKSAISSYPNVNEFHELMHNVHMERNNTKFKVFKPALEKPSKYELLCRGAFSNAPKKLDCYYQRHINYFTKLAPFRVEQLSRSPVILLFHDLLNDNEIEALKDSAFVGANDLISESRIAKGAWLDDNETETIRCVNRRIADMTGFNLEHSERINIVNYGLGGNYAPPVEIRNDRVATVMVYLSDIEQGGATVFTTLNITIKPRKGVALLWYNGDKNDSYESMLEHAECPVLVGSKWVLTKWIRRKDQFSIAPYLN